MAGSASTHIPSFPGEKVHVSPILVHALAGAAGAEPSRCEAGAWQATKAIKRTARFTRSMLALLSGE